MHMQKVLSFPHKGLKLQQNGNIVPFIAMKNIVFKNEVLQFPLSLMIINFKTIGVLLCSITTKACVNGQELEFT